MHHTPLFRKLAAAVAFLLALYSLQLPEARADEINDLIKTILDASPSARAGAESYAAEAAKRSPQQKILKKKQAPPAKPSIPVLQIPEEDLLEVDSKFPKDFVGKYIYGVSTLHDYQVFEDDDSALIGFAPKNWRGFYLQTRDPLVIKKFATLRRGMKFTIPKEFPLRIVGKQGFSYTVQVPSETFLSRKDYLKTKYR